MNTFAPRQWVTAENISVCNSHTAAVRAYYAAQVAAEEAEYAASLAEYAERGLRPRYCRHGRDMWTDHDIACYDCELGGYDTAEEIDRRVEAAFSQMAAALNAYAAVVALDVPPRMRRAIVGAAQAAVEAEFANHGATSL